MSKTLIFFGNERLVSGLPSTDAPILRALIDAGYIIKAVVSHHTDSQSRSNRPLEVAIVAAEHNIPVLLPNRPSDIIDELRAFSADAGILVAYGRIISQDVIDLFPHGIINLHPSLLPMYRGPTPIESAILRGDTETGVSIMALSAGMDEGPIYAQARVSIDGQEDKFDLYATLAERGKDLLLETLPAILSGDLVPAPQDNQAATYSSLLTKSDGLLDPRTIDAAQAERHVRAYLGYPKSKVYIEGHTVTILKAHISTQKNTPLDILCRDGAFLSIDRLMTPNGKSVGADDFIRGYLR